MRDGFNLAELGRLDPLLSTRAIPTDVQLISWQEGISKSIVPVSCKTSLSRPELPGEIEIKKICRTAGLVLVRSGPHEVVGTPKSASDELMWIVQLAGSMVFKHGPVRTIVRRGEARLYDPQLAHSMVFQRDFAQLLFRFPREWIDEAGLEAGDLLDLRRGLGTLAWSYLTELVGRLGDMEPLEAEDAAGMAAYLFARSARPERSADARWRSSTRLDLAKATAEQNLGNSQLSATVVATQMGISIRTLSALFARENDTFSAWVTRSRLKRASMDLRRDPSTSIAQIAYRWGFADQAHFSRSFSKNYGITPRAFRRTLLV